MAVCEENFQTNIIFT